MHKIVKILSINAKKMAKIGVKLSKMVKIDIFSRFWKNRLKKFNKFKKKFKNEKKKLI